MSVQFHVAGIFAFLFATFGYGQSVLTEAHVTSIGGQQILSNSPNLTIGIAPSTFGNYAELFRGVFVQNQDVGNTYISRATDSTAFDPFVALLTDGLVSSFGVFRRFDPLSGPSGIVGFPESRFFAALPPGSNGVDLRGFQIDYFALRFDELEVTSPGKDPNGDGFWTDYSCNATFSVYGQTIPEPDSCAVFSFGVAAL